MDGVVIHSTEEIPKIYVDYHVYPECYPKGFPSTGAEVAWWLDQRSLAYSSSTLTQFAPYADEESFRALVGTAFTIQPMSTLTHIQKRGDACLVTANARFDDDQHWLVKVRAANRLIKLGCLNLRVLSEMYPWEDS
jgi:hypothetical protein